MSENSMEPQEGSRPPEALQSYFQTIKACWQRLNEAEVGFHTEMLRRYPRAAGIVDWLLEFLYTIITSPASAVVLALLLVGLVISEVVTIIVSLSVFSAWLVCVISIARTGAVKEMPILRRFFAIFLFACVAAFFSHLYVKWVLLSYSKHHHESGPTMVHDKADALIIDRMKELLAR